MNIDNIRAMSIQAFNELELFRDQMFSIYNLCYSSNNWRSDIDNTQGRRTDDDQFNTAPVVNTPRFAALITNLIAPAGTKFFELTPRNNLTDSEEQSFKQSVAPVSDYIFEHLNSSNYYQALIEAMTDLASGTAGLVINFNDDIKELYFKSLDMSKVAFLEDGRGLINYVFRKLGIFDKLAQQRLFPDIDFKGLNEVNLMESVVPLDGKFIYRLSDVNYNNIYKEVESKTNPFIIFRWSKLSYETRGRGVLNNILGTIKMTNTMCRDMIDAAALINSPPFLTTNDSLINPYNVKFEPNALIQLADNDSLFKPLTYQGNLPFAMQEIQMQNEYMNQSMMLDILGQVGQARLTATEVDARLQLATPTLGAANSRLIRELHTPTFDRIIELLEMFGEIKPITIDMETGKPRKIVYKFTSPIINIQKQNDVQKIMQAIQATAQITGQQAQQYIDAAFKVEKLPYYIADSIGANLAYVNTDEETLNNLQQMAQAQAQQEAMQQYLQMAQSNPALGSQPVQTGVNQQ
jgi:hypothetical protein